MAKGIKLAQNIIGGIASTTTITYFLSPTFVIYRLIRFNEGEDEMPFLIYVFTILNCEFWALYGVIDKVWPLMLTNFTGLTLNVTYLCIFVLFQRKYSIMKRVIIIGIILASVFLCFIFFYFALPCKTILGTLAATSDMCMCFSPFQYVDAMYKERNNSYMPLSITLFMGFNNVAWTTFGFIRELDCFIIFPNFLGLLFNILQIFMWLQFYNDKRNGCQNLCEKYDDYDNEGLPLKGNDNVKED